MNMNRVVNQLINLAMRWLMNHGVKMAQSHLSGRKGANGATTAEEREQELKSRDLADKARKAARLNRRL